MPQEESSGGLTPPGGPAHPSTIENVDLQLRPSDLTCLKFQMIPVQQLGLECTFEGVAFESIPVGSTTGNIEVVELQAPANSHPWVPPKIRYLSAPAPGWLTATFVKPKKWVEISLAPAATPMRGVALGSLTINVQNSGWQSAATQLHEAPGVVRSYEFSASEVLIPGSPTCTKQPPLELEDIHRLNIYASASGILLWRICHWG